MAAAQDTVPSQVAAAQDGLPNQVAEAQDTAPSPVAAAQLGDENGKITGGRHEWRKGRQLQQQQQQYQHPNRQQLHP